MEKTYLELLAENDLKLNEYYDWSMKKDPEWADDYD
jgi:hypothetical protein